jgi:hypothetical protein
MRIANCLNLSVITSKRYTNSRKRKCKDQLTRRGLSNINQIWTHTLESSVNCNKRYQLTIIPDYLHPSALLVSRAHYQTFINISFRTCKVTNTKHIPTFCPASTLVKKDGLREQESTFKNKYTYKREQK